MNNREPAIVPVGDLPNYAEVEVDDDGNVALPSDFLLNIVDNIPDK